MTFRSRLRLFFTIIVIVPMIAVALVLFVLTGRSETGKADAAIAAGLRNAFAVYHADSDRARPGLRAVATDPDLRAAVESRDRRAARRRLALILRRQPSLVSIELYAPSGGLVARAGSAAAVASASAPLSGGGGRRLGTLSVSTTAASAFANEVSRLSGRDVTVFRGGQRLGSTVAGVRDEPERGNRDESRDFSAG